MHNEIIRQMAGSTCALLTVALHDMSRDFIASPLRREFLLTDTRKPSELKLF